MKEALRQRLEATGTEELKKMLAVSERELRRAEPHAERSFRAKAVADSNRTMIANLEEILGARA